MIGDTETSTRGTPGHPRMQAPGQSEQGYQARCPEAEEPGAARQTIVPPPEAPSHRIGWELFVMLLLNSRSVLAPESPGAEQAGAGRLNFNPAGFQRLPARGTALVFGFFSQSQAHCPPRSVPSWLRAPPGWVPVSLKLLTPVLSGTR